MHQISCTGFATAAKTSSCKQPAASKARLTYNAACVFSFSSNRSWQRSSRQHGFSLLEVLVAFAIAALALGMLYQIMGSNARQTGNLGQRERALTLANSLLTAYAVVPATDLHDSGESAGFAWSIDSAPYPTPVNAASPQAPRLHELSVSVSWQQSSIQLRTLRPEQQTLTGDLGNVP
jgi:general secretion pathway protein I